MARQHVATRDLRDEARLALMKTDEHRALLGDISHRETCPLPIAPGRPFDRPQDSLRTDLAQMPEPVFKGALLRRHLRRHVQMLHLAAAADAEVRAARHDALGAF